MPTAQPTVLKFGGTSVEDEAAFRRLAAIVERQRDQLPVVVVSAMSRFTDALVAAVTAAADGDLPRATGAVRPHLRRHVQMASALLDDEGRAAVSAEVTRARSALGRLLRMIAAHPVTRDALQDEVLAYGERLSSLLLAFALQAAGLPARCVDARRCILTDEQWGSAAPLHGETRSRTRAELLPILDEGGLPVLGGFIASTGRGATTTLGRGGSDYSAALIGAAVDAREIQIWTDVTGVLTADPRVVGDARPISRLSYAEAAELAYFGAKVLHPKTIQPAVEGGIPVRICNSRRPEEPGTLVTGQAEAGGQAAKAIAHKKGITALHITSARMLGAYGFLRALFEVFERHRTAVDVVTTSEVSVSLTLDDTRSLEALLPDLRRLGTVEVEDRRAIISIVGEGMRATPGVSGRVFNAVRDLNISLISQGASRINLTFVVDEQRADEAVTRLHEALFSQP